MADPTPVSPPQDLVLTPVHQAVLDDDLGQLVTLIKSREHGVDALDSRRATPIMLAAMAGRSAAFLFLMESGASRQRQDAEGLGLVDYVLPANAQRLTQIYQPHAANKRFSERRRRLLVALCKAISKSYRVEDAPPTIPVAAEGAQAVALPHVPAPVQTAPVEAPAPSAYKTVDVIIHQNNAVMFGTLSKTMGVIRGRAKDSPFHAMSVSGWRGDKAEGTLVLDNAKYTVLVRDVSRMYGLVLNGNPLDFAFPATAEDKKGIYYCCHSERQLATWLVETCISLVLGENNDGITVENVPKLRGKLGMLPADLRETTIGMQPPKMRKKYATPFASSFC